MIQGTTPTHVFTLGDDFAALAENGLQSLFITYAQCGVPLVEKDLASVSLQGGAVSVTLHQEDTLRFDPQWPVEIQIRFRTESGAYATGILSHPVERVLKAGVI